MCFSVDQPWQLSPRQEGASLGTLCKFMRQECTQAGHICMIITGREKHWNYLAFALEGVIAERLVGKRQMGWGKFSNLHKICLPFPVSKGLSDDIPDPLISSTGMREI